MNRSWKQNSRMLAPEQYGECNVLWMCQEKEDHMLVIPLVLFYDSLKTCNGASPDPMKITMIRCETTWRVV